MWPLTVHNGGHPARGLTLPARPPTHNRWEACRPALPERSPASSPPPSQQLFL